VKAMAAPRAGLMAKKLMSACLSATAPADMAAVWLYGAAPNSEAVSRGR